MKALLLTLLHLTVMTATLCGPGGVRAVIAEHLLLKQQLIVVRRPRQRAPHLTASDRLLFGFGSLFLSPGRIQKGAIGVRLCVSNSQFSRCIQDRGNVAWRLASGLLQRGTQPRVVEGPHAVDLRRRPHGGPCRAEQCSLDLPLPGRGPAPSGGLTTNSRRTRVHPMSDATRVKTAFQ